MDFPQRRGAHSPRNASPTAVPGQPRGHAGVLVQDALVSDLHRDVPIHQDACACAVFSSHRRMLLVIIG
jgi:hypothetical protein